MKHDSTNYCFRIIEIFPIYEYALMLKGSLTRSPAISQGRKEITFLEVAFRLDPRLDFVSRKINK